MQTDAAKYVIPIYESERGWGAKIDGYAGPFGSYEAAKAFQTAFNDTHNNLHHAPDWYIKALDPAEFKGQKCNYRSTVDAD